MQVRYCDVCGVKLPEPGMPGHVDGTRCEKCAATRGLASTTPPPLTPDGTARKTPIGGSSTAFAAPAKTPEPMPAIQEKSAPAGCMCFYFCEKCGKRVTAADLARGQGRDKQLKGVHCAACSDGTMTVAFDAISQAEIWKDEQARRQGQRRSTSTRLPVAKDFGRPASVRMHVDLLQTLWWSWPLWLCSVRCSVCSSSAGATPCHLAHPLRSQRSATRRWVLHRPLLTRPQQRPSPTRKTVPPHGNWLRSER